MVSRKGGRCACRSKREDPDVVLVSEGYEDWEWVNQFYVWHFKVDGKEVAVSNNTNERISAWSVVWDGAVDFDGNKKDLVKRYPYFAKYLN